ncbi:MAG: FliM/FliN family flagellar motor C-terminal domain-containing protein [Candidatus Melainabacteria bacterium]
MMIGLTQLKGEEPAERPGHSAVASAGQQAPVDDLMRWAGTLTDSLSEAIAAFWEQPVVVRLFSVSERQLYYWRPDDFYVSQLALDEAQSDGETESQHNLELRLSDALCERFFTQVLGQAPPRMGLSGKPTAFSFQWLSDVEQEVLQAFSASVLRWSAANLLRKSAKARPARRGLKQSPPPTVYMVWLVSLAGSAAPAGKLILSAPLPSLAWESPAAGMPEKQPAEPTTRGVSEAAILDALSTVTLSLGSTQASLSDLQQLSAGDWVVLENSRIQRMALLTPDGPAEFPVMLAPATIENYHVDLPVNAPFDETRQEVSMSPSATTASQPLWDTLMIDVRAEFDPLQLPLRQIREMVQGSVVQVGDLLSTPVHLRLDDSTLATGSLVIVGDQFGVRIDQIHAQMHAPAAQTETAAGAPDSAGPITGSAVGQIPGLPESPMPQQEQAQAPPQPEGQAAPAETPAGGEEELFDAEMDDDNFDEDDW